MSARGNIDDAGMRGKSTGPGFLDGLVRHRSGQISFVAVLVFVAVCALMQWLRTDLDWIEAPLSSYLKGPHGGWVRGAYYTLSIALMLLGAGLYRTLVPQARSALPKWLLVLAGVALIFTAISETNLPYLDHHAENQLHRLAAMTTFLSVTIAMMLQSWRFHYDDRWRVHFPLAFPLAVASFVALWIYAYWRGVPEGLVQKTLICMILFWLGSAAWWLRGEQLATVRAIEPPSTP